MVCLGPRRLECGSGTSHSGSDLVYPALTTTTAYSQVWLMHDQDHGLPSVDEYHRW